MLLLITGSDNRSSDQIVSKLGVDVFRLNFDLWSDYSLSLSPDGWIIYNPSGFSISSQTVTRAFYWKAFSYPIKCDKLTESEIRYIFRELYSWCALRGIIRGNSFDYHQNNGKINILSIAKKYFITPSSMVSIGLKNTNDFSSSSVIKSLSSEVTDDFKAIMTTEVNINDLDPMYPWFLQRKVESKWDITVFICGDKLFSFRRDRVGLKGLDWRAEQGHGSFQEKEWLFFQLDEVDSKRVFELSNDLGINWGRYDFLLNEDNKLVFLEFNANGQWGFLDPLDENGLLDQVVKYLR